MRKVFVSYSHSDRYYRNDEEKINNIVSKVVRFCEDNRISIWSDDVHKPGDKYEKLIQEHIHDSEYFLFISTNASNSSEYCRKEISWALEYNKTILPFRVEECRMCSDILSDALYSIHAIEYFKQEKRKCWEKLGETLLSKEDLKNLIYPECIQICSILVTADMDCFVSSGKTGTISKLYRNKCKEIGLQYYTRNPIELCFSLEKNRTTELLKTLIINSDDCQFIHAISVKLLSDYDRKRKNDQIYNPSNTIDMNAITQGISRFFNFSYFFKISNLLNIK